MLEDKMKETFSFEFDSEDNALILTFYGEMYRGILRNAKDLWENADAIVELMIGALKIEEHREGIWAWKIRNNWSEIIGCQLEVR